MDLRIIDFPEYPWKTLDVYKDFSYTFNISPGKKIEGDLFDSSKMKVVSYNENSHVQILAVCDPYGPPFYVRRGMGQYPDFTIKSGCFPLIERQITKPDTMGMLWKAGIKQPVMYSMGYNNNNCIGCVKGGMGYWNKIRKDFPEVFAQMAQIERDVGATCLKDKDGRIFLDELPTWRGDPVEEIIPDCSLICQIEFQEIMDRQVERVLKGEISINDVA